jgi:hypothetical protein
MLVDTRLWENMQGSSVVSQFEIQTGIVKATQ